MVLDVVEAMDRFNQHSRYKLKVRIGVDTGAAPGHVGGKRELHQDL
jgi:class 3 adenylate cyclase